MKTVNPKIILYAQESIFPRYEKVDEAHNMHHIRQVIANSLEIAAEYDVNPDMVYTIAAYHDLGIPQGRKTHHLTSAAILALDKKLLEWFSPEEITLMKEAVEDHRASAKAPPRSIYGCIIAEADRDLRPEIILQRTWLYGLKYAPNLNRAQQVERLYNHMLEKYAEGIDIVYGVRSSRDTDGFMKKLTAGVFYSLMQFFGADIIRNHADYRLLSKRVLMALDQYTEVNLFLRGLIRTCGFRSCTVEFEVSERFAGESKYSPSKMLKLAVDGITSFSVRPLRIIMMLGFCCVLFCIAWAVYDLVVFLQGKTIPGWTSIMLSLWLIAGMILISLGCVGEYVGRIYMETKRRPRYFVAESQHKPAEKK